MSAQWTVQQREWLQALGHDVLLLAGATDPAAGAAGAATRDASAAASRPRPTGQATVNDPLLHALLRAAGQHEFGKLADWLPDPATLRGNAAAKRALWPRLRTLRRRIDPP